MNKHILRRIRQAVSSRRYQITDHALEEADADDLTLEDIRNVLLTGDLEATYTDDPRGPRYVIRGYINEDQIDVVCRFRSDHVLLIVITVYVVD